MGQQDKLRIRYATRLTPFKMQQILTSLLFCFFFFLSCGIAYGNLSWHAAARVFW